MWDYDELFSEGNIVGLTQSIKNITHNFIVFPKEQWGETNSVDWNLYKNENLEKFGFKIQYIIKINNKGEISKVIFNRERDLPEPIPKIEDGMFIRVCDKNNYNKDNSLGYIDLNRNKIIFQDGSYKEVDRISKWLYKRITEIYPNTINSFNECTTDKAIWRDKEYEEYLNGKR